MKYAEKANADIRERARSLGVRHWQIAVELGIAESTLVKRLHLELSAEEKEQINKIIDRISNGE